MNSQPYSIWRKFYSFLLLLLFLSCHSKGVNCDALGTFYQFWQKAGEPSTNLFQFPTAWAPFRYTTRSTCRGLTLFLLFLKSRLVSDQHQLSGERYWITECFSSSSEGPDVQSSFPAVWVEPSQAQSWDLCCTKHFLMDVRMRTIQPLHLHQQMFAIIMISELL